MIVTERGVCVNPRREDLLPLLLKNGVSVLNIKELRLEVERLTGTIDSIEFDDSRVAALVEYRDGTIIDVVYGFKK